MPHELRIGCSGWNYGDWKHAVYEGLPARRWLERYATLFDTVEVNSSFYRLPTRSAVEGWVRQTPPGFLFAVKASRYLTHIKRLRELPPGIERLEERIAPLRESGKLGPILWQLPPNFRRDDERLEQALQALPPGRHAFEFRDPSWFHDDVMAGLAAHDVALVIGDSPRREFQTLARPAGWTFVRFHHGHQARLGGGYSARELAGWAERLRAWRAEGDVYAYFNNDWTAHAVRDAQALIRLTGAPSGAAIASTTAARAVAE
jgi:uncharacterized protein YecE (DUF72 family)